MESVVRAGGLGCPLAELCSGHSEYGAREGGNTCRHISKKRQDVWAGAGKMKKMQRERPSLYRECLQASYYLGKDKCRGAYWT
jgi:hypothetical protein